MECSDHGRILCLFLLLIWPVDLLVDLHITFSFKDLCIQCLPKILNLMEHCFLPMEKRIASGLWEMLLIFEVLHNS